MPGHAEGGRNPLIAEQIEDFRAVAGVGAGIEGERHLEPAVRAPFDDRAEAGAGVGRWRQALSLHGPVRQRHRRSSLASDGCG